MKRNEGNDGIVLNGDVQEESDAHGNDAGNEYDTNIAMSDEPKPADMPAMEEMTMPGTNELNQTEQPQTSGNFAFEQALQDAVEAENRAKINKQHMLNLTNDLTAERRENANLQLQLNTAQAQLASANDSITALKQAAELALVNHKGELTRLNDAFSAERDRMQAEIELQKKDIADTQEKLTAATQQEAIAKGKLDLTTKDLVAAQADAKKSRDDLAKKTQELTGMSGELGETRANLANATDKVAALDREVSELKLELVQYKQ